MASAKALIADAGIALTPSSGRATVRLLKEYRAHYHSPYAYEVHNFFCIPVKINPPLISRRDLLADKEHISSRYKPPTAVAWKLTAVGGFLRYAHEQCAIPEDITRGMKGPCEHQGQPEFLTTEEVRVLLRAADRRLIIPA